MLFNSDANYQKSGGNLKILPFFLFLVFVASGVLAQEHSDIWFVLDNNQTTVSDTDLSDNSPVLVDLTTGQFLFSADFGDLQEGEEGTRNPGVQTLSGTFSPGAVMFYRAIGSLMFWDGSEWVNSVADNEQILITDALESVTTITTTGVINSEGAIDQIDSEGLIHQHVIFNLDNSLGSGTPTTGAYMIELEFFVCDFPCITIVHTVSETVRVTFNYKLDSNAYLDAIHALTEPQDVSVPIPYGFVFLLVGLLMLVQKRYRA